MLNYTSTSVDSTLESQCEEGFLPEVLIISRCNINGDWKPDPSQHNCSLAEITTYKGDKGLQIYPNLPPPPNPNSTPILTSIKPNQMKSDFTTQY